MSTWDSYAQLDVDLANGHNTHTAVTRGGLLYLLGMKDSETRTVHVCSGGAVYNNDALARLDASRIEALQAEALGIIHHARNLNSEAISLIVAGELEEQFSLAYSLRRATVSQYEGDLQAAHELAINPARAAGFLHGKDPVNHIELATPPEFAHTLTI